MAKKEKNEVVDTSKVYEKSLAEVLHQSMMPYSEYVILDRAIPRVEDGLKPVQRRIIFSMYELGVTPDKPYRKSARIVGDCLGKYHPHGDTSVYGALVNLAQDFKTRNPLVDGHGNYGSIDGDSAAAMRYTEARLTPLAMELIRDLEKDTVHWSFNFDDTLKEPDVLPSRYPNLLVNGASGIAIGMATKIPPHNLGEVIDGIVAYIDNQQIDLDEIMQYIKGPDFPTGGYVIVGDDLRKAYETGVGKVSIKAKFTVEKDGDKSKLIITEIPYEVEKADLLQKIKALKDKEDKNAIFSGIGEVVDQSGRDGMRAVVTIKKGVNAQKLVNEIVKKTALQTNFSLNMIAIANGKPKQMGLLEIISYYVEYQRNIILKRTQYDLAQAIEREHILQGLVIAIENIHDVIDLIKNAKSTTDAKAALRERYKLSERQAQAILDMKLARLAKLEVNKLRDEIAYLQELIKEYQSIVASKKKQYAVLRKEILEIKKKYKSERRSVIVNESSSQVKAVEIKDVNEREPKEGVVVLTQEGAIKFLSQRAYNMANKNLADCDLAQVVKQTLTIDNNSDVIAFTNKGNALVFNIDSLGEDKWKSKGVFANKLAPDVLVNEKVIGIFNNDSIEKEKLYFVTKQGTVKATMGSEYNLSKKNYAAMNVKEDDEVISVIVADSSKTLFFVSKEAKCLNCEVDKIPTQGRTAGGVRCMKLNDNDFVVGVEQVDDEGEVVVVTKKGIAKRVIVGLIPVTARDAKGMLIQTLDENDEIIHMSYVKSPYDLACEISDYDTFVSINTEDIEIKGRVQTARFPFKLTEHSKIERVLKHNI